MSISLLYSRYFVYSQHLCLKVYYPYLQNNEEILKKLVICIVSKNGHVLFDIDSESGSKVILLWSVSLINMGLNNYNETLHTLF